MLQDLRFVHLSDLHVGPPDPPDPHLLADTALHLQQTVALIAALQPQPDFVVISGDLTNHGSPAAFERVRHLLKPLGMPLVLALGNHDHRRAFRQVMLGQDSDTPYYYSQTLGGLKILVLDSSIPGQLVGGLDPAQWDWLEAELAASVGQPKLVVVHHPPMPIGFSVFDQIGFDPQQGQRLGRLLRHQQVVGLLSGHIHYDRFSLWNGIPSVITAGLHNLTDVLNPNGIHILGGGGFHLCQLSQGELAVTQVSLPRNHPRLQHVSLETLRPFLRP